MAIKKGNILSIFGVKGGIGKSTLVLNFAGICEILEKRVLILDLDLYGGSIALALNKEPKKTIFNFVDDYNNNRYNNVKDYVTNYSKYIDFIACPKDPRQANKIDSKYIEILLDKVKFNYDIVLIDTTHILDEININVLDKSDKILFVVSNDMFDIKNMRSLISIFKDLDIKKYKILLNESFRTDKEYFSLYDIKDVIKNNIDYLISSKFYYKNIDELIINGSIPTLNKKTPSLKDYKILESIILDINGDQNE